MADYYLKTDNIMKNMFTVALKDETGSPKSDGKGSSGYRSHAAESPGL